MAEKTFHRYVDLDDALEDKKIPLENRPIIRAFVATIGCAKFESTTSYIKATRRQPGPDLNIAYGWTTGFATREEPKLPAGLTCGPGGGGGESRIRFICCARAVARGARR